MTGERGLYNLQRLSRGIILGTERDERSAAMQNVANQLECRRVHGAGRVNAECDVVHGFAAMHRFGNHEMFVFGPVKLSGDSADSRRRWRGLRRTVN